MSDPILDAIVSQAPEGMFGEEDEAAASDQPYGVGTWQGAELAEVIDYPKDAKYGWKVGLKFNLKERLPYTGRFDLPQTVDKARFMPVVNGHETTEAELAKAEQSYAWACGKEEKRLKFLKEAMSALGFTKKQAYTAIDTEEQYNTITAALRQLIGNRADVKVVLDGKNIKAEDGSWTFVSSEKGYTRFAWIKASRKK
jgi:hypothetical protein